MAIPYVTGPVAIWVGLNAPIPTTADVSKKQAPAKPRKVAASASSKAVSSGSSAKYHFLGHSMRGPRIKVRRAYSKVFCDLTSGELPFDYLWAGEEAIIFADLTRWNELVYQAIATRPFSDGQGAEPAGARGTLLVTEKTAFELILRFPAFDYHEVFSGNGGLAGYRFFNAFLDGEDDFETGSAANVRHCAFHAVEEYDPQTNGLALFEYKANFLLPTVPD